MHSAKVTFVLQKDLRLNTVGDCPGSVPSVCRYRRLCRSKAPGHLLGTKTKEQSTSPARQRPVTETADSSAGVSPLALGDTHFYLPATPRRNPTGRSCADGVWSHCPSIAWRKLKQDPARTPSSTAPPLHGPRRRGLAHRLMIRRQHLPTREADHGGRGGKPNKSLGQAQLGRQSS